MPVGEEVLERLRPLAVRAGRAHPGVERQQAALEVAARRVVPGADAEVAADRSLAANLVVGEVAGAGGEGGGVLLEREQRIDRGGGADRDGVAVDRDAVEPCVREQEHAARIEPTVRDVGDDDRAAADHRRRRAVAEELDGLGRGRRDEYFRSHIDPFSVRVGYDCCLPPMPQCFGSTPWITTWMCSGAAPLDSASAFVSASIIFGTDSSVTRRSYSLTSIMGTMGLLRLGRPVLGHGLRVAAWPV